MENKMGTTEFTDFRSRGKSSEPKDIKAPMSVFLMWQNARAQNKVKYEVMGSESFKVVSKESPIKELK